MQADVEMDWSVLESVDFSERTEDPCEHSGHRHFPEIHGGPGEWLLRLKPCKCGTPARDMLVCDMFFQKIPMINFRCKVCRQARKDPYTVLGRKGVDF